MTALRAPILLVCSVEQEAAPLREHLTEVANIPVPSRSCVRGEIGGTPVILLVGGMGKANAAHALAVVLTLEPVESIVGFGVAGAYAGSRLEPGQVALATSEFYGDEGAQTPSGWISTRDIGIPLAETDGSALFNEFPLDPLAVARAQRLLAETGTTAAAGPFVTVSCCSGTAARGADLATRFNAICESMEGAAYAHIATLHGAPFLEIRGISNRVEDRDLSAWRLHEAAAAAANAVRTIIRGQ